jgi:hypothetical protein
MGHDKARIRKTIHNIRRIKTWQLVVVLILMVFVAATFWRLNNVGMAQRRDAVKAADKAGSTDEVQARLYDLQRYTVAHMNADTGVFYLEEQYSRDSQAVIDTIKSMSGGQTVNEKAEAVCKPQFTHYTYAYTQCMLSEITKANQVIDPATLPKMPDPSLYRISYTSPLWSPDFAGFSTLICLAIIVLILMRGLSLVVLKMLLKRHYRGI